MSETYGVLIVTKTILEFYLVGCETVNIYATTAIQSALSCSFCPDDVVLLLPIYSLGGTIHQGTHKASMQGYLHVRSTVRWLVDRDGIIHSPITSNEQRPQDISVKDPVAGTKC